MSKVPLLQTIRIVPLPFPATLCEVEAHGDWPVTFKRKSAGRRGVSQGRQEEMLAVILWTKPGVPVATSCPAADPPYHGDPCYSEVPPYYLGPLGSLLLLAVKAPYPVHGYCLFIDGGEQCHPGTRHALLPNMLLVLGRGYAKASMLKEGKKKK